MTSKSSLRNKRLSAKIRILGVPAPLPCHHCLFEHTCIIMPSVSARCERCVSSGRRDCIAVSWESVDRTVVNTREEIVKEEDEADVEEEEVLRLEESLKKVRESWLSRRRRLRRLRKVLKLAESRAIDQARCLEEEILAESQQVELSSSFGPSVQELASMSPARINWELGDGDPLIGVSSG